MLITTDALLYEEIDGTPVYYKGYHRVLAGQKSAEEIMGSSVSQAMIISIILDFLYRTLNRKAYRILTNEYMYPPEIIYPLTLPFAINKHKH